MLISHSYNFIFTKTFKTAGTSVERYFEPYCLGSGEQKKGDEEWIGKCGVIGKRGSRNGAEWYAHMPAEEVKRKLGSEKWNSYFKFTIVRNPFDQLVSAYFFMLKLKQESNQLARFKSNIKGTFGILGEVFPGNNPDHIANFRHWIKKGAWFDDSKAYLIDSVNCMDFIMRYESLMEDLEVLCENLGVPFQPENFGHHKSQYRLHSPVLRELYDARTIDLVNKRYKDVLKMFQYSFPE